MQQFVVPQFLDVEDKVIGPITVRQFIILLVAGGLVFVAYKVSDFTLFLLWLLLIAVLTIVFAFIKINGRPVHYLLLNIFETLNRPHLTLWDKRVTAAELKRTLRGVEVKPIVPHRVKPLVGSSRLAELSLIVDTGGVYEGEEE